MSQKLIMPINKCRITAGYKNANYTKEFGYTHYGVDMTDKDRKDYTLFASGKGTVYQCGWHASGGNVVVIIYRDCELPCGRTCDIVLRYFHLKSIKVVKGQKVSKDTVIGLYGNTGASSGAHLHLEADTDVNYPIYTPQVSSKNDNSILRKGTASTMLNPVDVLWVKTSRPDYQAVVTSGYNTVTKKDVSYKSTK